MAQIGEVAGVEELGTEVVGEAVVEGQMGVGEAGVKGGPLCNRETMDRVQHRRWLHRIQTPVWIPMIMHHQK